MLSCEELVKLERDLRDRMVLSVYVNGQSRDPATRHRWQLDLRHSLDATQGLVDLSAHAEREAFAACRTALTEWLESDSGMAGVAGWAGFLTADGPFAGGPLPLPVPTMAVWSRGACIAPYFAALREALPVFVAVVDARRALLFKYAFGRVTALGALRAQIAVEPPSHMGRPARRGFHSGTRGRTGTDAYERDRREGTARMLADLRDELARRVGSGGWIVVGGIPEIAAAAVQLLRADFPGHVAQADSLDVHATRAQIAECARKEVSALRSALELDEVSRVIDDAQRFGRGEVGPVVTREALRSGTVANLYLSSHFVANHAADAEELVRLALDSRAAVEYVSGAAAEALEAVGGVAARLRYAGNTTLEELEVPSAAVAR